MIWRALVLISFFSSQGFAQQYDADAELKGQAELTRAGKLVNLTVQPGAKQVLLQFAAKDVATLKIADDSVDAFYGQGANRQRLKLMRLKSADSKQNVFFFERPSTPIEHLQINVRQGKAKETFEIPSLR